MANITYAVGPERALKTLVDLGDGTYAEKVVAVKADGTAIGGAGAATIADGADVTQGAKADAAQPDPTQTASLIALIKGLLTTLGLKTSAADTHTDVTSIPAMSVWKQISASVQAAAASLLAGLPASLGQKTSANSTSVVLASDGLFAQNFPDPTTYTASRVKSAATTNATSLKASAGRVLQISLFNTSATLKYLKLYNKASAPTVGSDTPSWTIPLPAGGGFSEDFSHGFPMSTGIAYAITGALVDSDTTAVAVDEVHGQIMWI